jgi:hypothetical protein
VCRLQRLASTCSPAQPFRCCATSAAGPAAAAAVAAAQPAAAVAAAAAAAAVLSPPATAAGAAAGAAAVLQADAAATPTAAAATTARLEFYKRELPDGCIPFESAEGKALFAEALSAGTMECYFPLAAQFRTQDEPAFCGLSTLVMTLNALRIDPRRLWKGPWRWFNEDMLDCCMPVEVVRQKGIDLDTFACLARCNSAASDVVRAWPPPPPLPPGGTRVGGASSSSSPSPAAEEGGEDAGEAAFRSAVRRASTTGEGEFLILSYSRKGLGQTGDGHFSPLGGYHAGRDMVLILDVARFKYPPHWVPLRTLWRAMQRTDPETNMPRGYVWLRRLASAPLLLFHLPAVGVPVSGGSGSGGSSVEGTGVCLNKRLNSSLEAGLAAGKAALSRAPRGPSDAPEPVPVPPVAAPTATTGGCATSVPGCAQCDESTLLGTAVYEFVAAFEGATQGQASALSAAAASSAAAAEAGCVDKLSREHITAASALIDELEATPIYPHVVAALARLRPPPQQQSQHQHQPGSSVRGRTSSGGAGPAVTLEYDEGHGHSHGSGGCKDPTHHHNHSHSHGGVSGAGASTEPSLILTSSTSDSTTAAVTAAVRAGETLLATPGASPRRKAAAEAAVRAVCENHGTSCIRVKKAHVLTVSSWGGGRDGVRFIGKEGTASA